MNDEIDGYVIDVKDYRENDALLTILSEEHGQITMVARGIKKVKSKNAPACQLFTFARLQLNYREHSAMQTLVRAEIIESYRHIREDLLKQSVASYLCECIYKSKLEDEEDIFILLSQCLEILKNKEENDPIRVLCMFQAIMNRYHGIEPYVDGCVGCNRVHDICALSVVAGGFICKACYQAGKARLMNAEDLKSFRLLCKASMEHYELLKAYPAFTYQHFELLFMFFEEYAGIQVKSIEFLRCLMKMEEN